MSEIFICPTRIPQPLRPNSRVITVKQLKDWVRDLPEVDALGDETEVWIGTEEGRSSPCQEIWPLNVRDKETLEESCSILLIPLR